MRFRATAEFPGTIRRAPPQVARGRSRILHNLLKFQGFNASYGMDTPAIRTYTQSLFPEIVETDLLLQHLLAPRQELGNIAQQQVHQRFAILFRAYQRGLALDAH